MYTEQVSKHPGYWQRLSTGHLKTIPQNYKNITLLRFCNTKSQSNHAWAMNINSFCICILMKNIYIYFGTCYYHFSKGKSHPHMPQGGNFHFSHSGWKPVHPLMGQLQCKWIMKAFLSWYNVSISTFISFMSFMTQWKHLSFHSYTLACQLNS